MNAATSAVVPGDATSRFLAAPRRMLIGGEWREACSGARADVRELTRQTFLEKAPVIAVSTITNQGIEELKGALLALAQAQLPTT